MISPWRNLNTRGKTLSIACVVNMWVAVYLATEGAWLCLFSGLMAAFCGIMTYDKRYQHQDAKDINDGREK